MENCIMKLSKFKKNNFKKITKLSLLATVMVLLTWSTPNFCPLTFGQGSSLKALDRTPENLARTIAAVESAVGDKDPGVKVLIKHYGSGATKAALLETLRKMQVVMPAGGTAAAASKRLTEGVRAAAAAETAVIAAVAAAEVAEARVVVDKRAVLAASAAASSGAGGTGGSLTFGQGSSLKALDVSQVSNLDKVIAAVAAATGDRDPGIKVLAKHHGSTPTKADLLAKLQEKRVALTGEAVAAAVATAGAGVTAEPMPANILALNAALTDLYAQLAANSEQYKAADDASWSWGKSDTLKVFKAAGAVLEQQIKANEKQQFEIIKEISDNKQKLVAAFNLLQTAGLLKVPADLDAQRVLTNIKMEELLTGAKEHPAWRPIVNQITKALEAVGSYDKQEKVQQLEQMIRILGKDYFSIESLVNVADAWDVSINRGDESIRTLSAKLIAKVEAQIAQIKAGERPTLLELPSDAKILALKADRGTVAEAAARSGAKESEEAEAA